MLYRKSHEEAKLYNVSASDRNNKTAAMFEELAALWKSALTSHVLPIRESLHFEAAFRRLKELRLFTEGETLPSVGHL